MSAPQNWSTAERYVTVGRRRLGVSAFDLDPCAESHNAKARHYYSFRERGENGLTLPWTGNVWLQPPWNNIQPWVCRGLEYVGRGYASNVIAFLPTRSDRAWFQTLWYLHVGHLTGAANETTRLHPGVTVPWFQFTDHRPPFGDPLGKARSQPREACFWAHIAPKL